MPKLHCPRTIIFMANGKQSQRFLCHSSQGKNESAHIWMRLNLLYIDYGNIYIVIFYQTLKNESIRLEKKLLLNNKVWSLDFMDIKTCTSERGQINILFVPQHWIPCIEPLQRSKLHSFLCTTKNILKSWIFVWMNKNKQYISISSIKHGNCQGIKTRSRQKYFPYLCVSAAYPKY